MARWLLFAIFAALTAWLVLPPTAPPLCVVVAIFVDALLFGLALTPHVERRSVVVADEEREAG